MNEHDLVRKVIEVFEKLTIRYFITGGMAAIAYGEPRFTSDIDVVADIPLNRVSLFIAEFPFPEYYVEESTARDAVLRRSQFNILHTSSALKVDVMIPKLTEYDRLRMSRATPLQVAPDLYGQFATPEDVILKKLVWFQAGQSEKHLRDIAAMLLIRPNIDLAYLNKWAAKLNVSNEWDLVRQRVSEATE